ncbi:uncharacterized protein SCHCODRAFT_01165515 [Schizophyllum commune H4-8]|nr:uncharacterized protein SCHCODRAFT_01165515 [Schizophyllum commune H4-8]KAI5893133.1 hypothetical protein SCHCODRAFT_01165515 [Schizophyllum commune H4-8]
MHGLPAAAAHAAAHIARRVDRVQLVAVRRDGVDREDDALRAAGRTHNARAQLVRRERGSAAHIRILHQLREADEREAESDRSEVLGAGIEK